MSDLDNAINSINASAAKAENTATFLDDMSTLDDQASVTNPNNGKTVASIPKQVKDRTDELFAAAESDINQAVSDAEQSATDAQDAADSIGRYQGLWPGTGGSANKGDTYQTQVSGAPTGQYFTALKNTTADPIGDNINWREVVSDSVLQGAIDSLSLDTIPIRGTASGNLLSSISRGARTDVILIGDSITEGVGASVWSNRYSNMFEKSLNGNVPGGFGYGLNVNMFNTLEEPNISTTGQLIAGSTTTGSVLRLDDGEYILMSQYQLDFVDVIYDGTSSSGSMDVLIDDTVVASETLLTTSDTLTTFPTPITRTDKSNAIKIQANGGTIIVKSIVPLRKAFNAPILQRYGKSGWGYQDFNLQSSVDEINKITTLLGSVSQVVVLALGTNNIYNASKSLTPEATVAEARSLISKLKATLSNPHFMVVVPPQASENTWPVIESGFTYADYRDATLNMIEADGHQAFRADLIGLLGSGLYADGLHPDDSGHILYAQRLCHDLGIPFLPYRDDIHQADKYVEPPLDCTYNSTWGDFGADPTKRLQAIQIKNQVFLSGIVQPNGSVSTAVGAIPVGIDPPGQRDAFTVTRDNGGVALVSISAGGQIQVDSVPSTWISFDNVSYTVR